jgi:GcrA cell cycle regulator
MSFSYEHYIDAGWQHEEAQRLAGVVIEEKPKKTGLTLKPNGTVNWRDDRNIKILVKMKKAGLSNGQIAIKLNVTRNVIVGQSSRMGLAALGAVAKRAKTKKVNTKVPDLPKIPNRVVKIPKFMVADFESPAKPSPEDTPTKYSKRPDELEDGQCKWPLGDPLKPDFVHCGCEQQVGSVYCSAHHARSYYTPKKKKIVFKGTFERGSHEKL